jgi:hypothetical protein
MEAFPIVDAGVDYLSVTASAQGGALRLDQYANEVLYEKRESGQRIRPDSRFGFRGLRSEHFFTGVSDHGCIVVVSGAECVPLAAELITRCENVTRMDFQVTVSCGRRAPLLAGELYSRARANYAQHRTRRSLNLQVCYPSGATLSVGKRISDWYGRVYDKATQARLGPAGSFWRYEVELKRKPARAAAIALVDSGSPTPHVIERVWTMFNDRQVYPAFTMEPSGLANHPLFPHVPSNSLRWFNDTVRYSVSKAVRRHGLAVTLRALGLDTVVQPMDQRQEGHKNG